VDEIREKRNLNAKSMKGKMEAEARAALVAEGKSLKEELAAVEGGLNALVGAVQAGYPAHP
jgi:seryl-tRNA synthetase